jgi:hypothetical protein
VFDDSLRKAHRFGTRCRLISTYIAFQLLQYLLFKSGCHPVYPVLWVKGAMRLCNDYQSKIFATMLKSIHASTMAIKHWFKVHTPTTFWCEENVHRDLFPGCLISISGILCHLPATHHCLLNLPLHKSNHLRRRQTFGALRLEDILSTLCPARTDSSWLSDENRSLCPGSARLIQYSHEKERVYSNRSFHTLQPTNSFPLSQTRLHLNDLTIADVALLGDTSAVARKDWLEFCWRRS